MKFIRSALAAAALMVGISTAANAAYVEFQTPQPGGYALTFNNPTGFFSECEVRSSLGGYYKFVIYPWSRYSVYLTGPSSYTYFCF